MEVTLGDKTYSFDWWKGQQLYGSLVHPIALDTETEVVTDPLTIPRLALGVASDGVSNVLIHPRDMGRFLLLQREMPIVFHNAAFDFWVLNDSQEGLGLLAESANRGSLRDTMLLEMLIQLGSGNFRIEGDKVYGSGLGDLAAEYLGYKLDKEDPYRMRYSELLGKTKFEIDQMDSGFKTYAIKDAITTWLLYPKLRERALEIMHNVGYNKKAKQYEIDPESLDKYGPLGEAIQVRAAIALQKTSRRPICIEQRDRTELDRNYRHAITQAVESLDSEAPGLFKRFKEKKRAGQFKVSKKSGLPSMTVKVLTDKLVSLASAKGFSVPYSIGKERRISASAKQWAPHAKGIPFIEKWIDLEHKTKRLELITAIDAPQVWTRYDLLKLTGRTSASAWKENKKQILPGLNLQQVPKDKEFRALFRPSPGKVWVISDYAYLELRTLAAVCRARFGYSKLGDAIVEHTAGKGLDPHQVTAAAMLGTSPDHFITLPTSRQKEARQQAKAVNFGLPGGLGSKRLVEYAEGSYGVKISEDDAKGFKKAWLTTFPEMKEYLADRTAKAIGEQLGLYESYVRDFLGNYIWDVSRVLQGQSLAKEDREEKIWNMLKDLCREAGKDTGERGKRLDWLTLNMEKLVLVSACTLTGRVRAGCKYTDASNTPFQGLAADGAKEAVWRLMYEGYDVAAFIHDEIIVECLPEEAEATAKAVDRIMVEEMEKVCGHGIPVACETHIAECWTK